MSTDVATKTDFYPHSGTLEVGDASETGRLPECMPGVEMWRVAAPRQPDDRVTPTIPLAFARKLDAELAIAAPGESDEHES